MASTVWSPAQGNASLSGVSPGWSLLGARQQLDLTDDEPLSHPAGTQWETEEEEAMTATSAPYNTSSAPVYQGPATILHTAPAAVKQFVEPAEEPPEQAGFTK